MGPFLYTLSGTAGYTYSSVGRGIPAIAFSGGNGDQRSYQWINATTPSGYPDPATIQAQLAVKIVNTLANNTAPGERPLPQGLWHLCQHPPRHLFDERLLCQTHRSSNPTSLAAQTTTQAVLNATTGLFKYKNIVPPNGVGGNMCINGNCSLLGETEVLDDGCQSSVSVFTVDYDAPTGTAQSNIRSRLSPLVQYFPNSTTTSTGTSGGYGQKARPYHTGGHHRMARSNM